MKTLSQHAQHALPVEEIRQRNGDAEVFNYMDYHYPIQYRSINRFMKIVIIGLSLSISWIIIIPLWDQYGPLIGFYCPYQRTIFNVFIIWDQ
jgi:hypothetical protein